MQRISRSSYKPIYIQICDLIREKIDSGKLSPGNRVWSEHDIMEKFHVSRNTAQKAIETLVNEGIVSRVQGKGSFVTQPKVDYGLQHLASFTEETFGKGLKPTSKVICFNREHPNHNHANNLKISKSDWVYKLERLRLADEYPIAHQISIIPEKLCPGLLRYDFSEKSLYEVFEKDFKHILSWQKIIISPIVASDDIAEIFDILPQTPLLHTDSILYLAGGTPIESNKNIYLGERYQFTVLSHRNVSSRRTEEK
jgi:GntR family transcriptional regulator